MASSISLADTPSSRRQGINFSSDSFILRLIVGLGRPQSSAMRRFVPNVRRLPSIIDRSPITGGHTDVLSAYELVADVNATATTIVHITVSFTCTCIFRVQDVVGMARLYRANQR